jgi:RNA polymerase sigma-70 factor (ECF subfamily)
MGQREDADLVTAALAGGPEAFNPIVERHRGDVYGVALARLRNFDEAEDIAQQVFIEAFLSLHTLRDPKRLAAWLRSATIHRSVDVLRKRQDTVELDADAHQLTNDLTPEVELERRQIREQVLDAIGRLSNAQRETTTLFYLGEHSLQEIAAIQEIPVGTVKRRLHDARQQLKSEMLQMVEDTLKTEAPSEDFSEQVFQLLTRYYRDPKTYPRTWAEQRKVDALWESEIGDSLRAFGGDGIEGFALAMQHPQALTRRYALQCLAFMYLEHPSSAELKGIVLKLITEALKDPNKKVRTRAAFYLLERLGLDENYVREEVLPIVLHMLRDPTAFVRDRVARRLCRWAYHVPLKVAAGALATYPNTKGPHLARLVNLVIEAQKKETSSVS